MPSVPDMALDTHLRVELVMAAMHPCFFEIAEPLWHRDHGKQYGAENIREVQVYMGCVLFISRAGTPSDHGTAERVVGAFTLEVADRRPSHTLGQFLYMAEVWITFSNQERLYEGLENLSLLHSAKLIAARIFFLSSSRSVYLHSQVFDKSEVCHAYF